MVIWCLARGSTDLLIGLSMLLADYFILQTYTHLAGNIGRCSEIRLSMSSVRLMFMREVRNRLPIQIYNVPSFSLCAQYHDCIDRPELQIICIDLCSN
jgi:hypothetical protein